MKTCWLGWHNWYIVSSLKKGEWFNLTSYEYPMLYERLIKAECPSDQERQKALRECGMWFDLIAKKTLHNRVCKDCNKIELQIEEALPSLVEVHVKAKLDATKYRQKLESALKVARMKHGAVS